MSRTYTREQVEQVVTKHLGENGVRTILRDLDALPNPPAAPESSAESCPVHPGKNCAPETPGVYECRIHSDPGVLIKATPIQRPRATTPVPEVPALKDETCPCPDAPAQHKFSCNLAQPVPTAREVVWEGDVRNLRNVLEEYHEEFPDSHGLRVARRSLESLARALAEAKREAAQHSVAGEAVRHAALNQSWAAAGGDVIAIHAALLASDTADAVHEAAESMRERAALILDKYIRIENPDAIANTIRALPLEEP